MIASIVAFSERALATGARQRQEVVERRRGLDHLRLGRAAAAIATTTTSR
jgi:hypothetical protein